VRRGGGRDAQVVPLDDALPDEGGLR
jgi:hypothetical protein